MNTIIKIALVVLSFIPLSRAVAGLNDPIPGTFHFLAYSSAEIYLNGTRVNIVDSKSKTTTKTYGLGQTVPLEIKPGDRLVVKIYGSAYNRHFSLIFVGDDGKSYAFQAREFKNLPDASATDFDPRAWSQLTKTAGALKGVGDEPLPGVNRNGRKPEPIYAHSEAGFGIVGLIITSSIGFGN